MKPFFCLLICLCSCCTSLWGQIAVETAPPSYIRTLIFSRADGYSGVPIVRLGEAFQLSFDDIIGDEANYYYTIEHYNYDWTPSQLVKSEYLEGFDNVRIDTYNNSLNTLQLYSHYELEIPNEDTRGLKVSGNYMIHIYNENRELVFSRKFMVYEPVAAVEVEIKKSREVELIQARQVVNWTVSSPGFVIRNPEESVWAVVLQNNNLKTAIYNIRPQYNLGNTLVYKYDELTSFWAGNEYLNFDSKDVLIPTSKIRAVEVRDLYHHFLFPDEIRAFEPYTYNPDINGKFLVRILQASDPGIEADYVWTHFALRTGEYLEGGEIHLFGEFNNFVLDETTRLTYDEASGVYENARLFKQGYYDYKYVFLTDAGVVDEGFISGNFATTENEYTVIIYYLPPGGRYTRIIGVGSANSRNISN